jgi:hypothetical protein
MKLLIYVKCLALFFQTLVVNSFAFEKIEDWKVKKYEMKYFIELRSDSSVLTFLTHFGGYTPKILTIEKVKENPNWRYIVYFSGEEGTSRQVVHHRFVLYDISKKTILLERPFRYVFLDKRGSFEPQPKFTYSKSKLIYYDEVHDLRDEVKF